MTRAEAQARARERLDRNREEPLVLLAREEVEALVTPLVEPPPQIEEPYALPGDSVR